MFILKPTNQFKKDAKKAIKRASQNLELIEAFLEKLRINGASGI
jgi:mRNA interferase YafQ